MAMFLKYTANRKNNLWGHKSKHRFPFVGLNGVAASAKIYGHIIQLTNAGFQEAKNRHF